MISPPRTVILLVVGMLMLGSPGLPALVFFEAGDPAHNREVAPGGAWTDSGWQYQGEYKDFLGTMISPRHFITASHLGLGATTFVHKAHFSKSGTARTYFLNPNANGGIGYWNLAGTDLRVFEVYGDFPEYAPLYAGTRENGKEVVMIGRGVPRGDAVTLSGETRGWRWGSRDGFARWGTNEVDATTTLNGAGEMLVTDFDARPGSDECQATIWDSGGAVFLKDAGTWKLAGIMYAVDGSYDTNTTCGDASNFNAAMFDAGGFFVGSDNAECDDWQLVTPEDDTDESRTYSSRISSSAEVIQAIIQDALNDELKTSRQRFDDWIGEFGISGDLLPGDDADRDQWPNVVEYLAALDPSVDDGAMSAFSVEAAGDRIRFTLRIRLDAAARGLSWEIQETGDPVGGEFAGVAGLSQVGLTRSLPAGSELIEFETARPAESRMFYRLEVTLAP